MQIKAGDKIFINCPFDKSFQPMFVALISSLTLLELEPKSVLQVAADNTRIDRLVKIIRQCPVSLHDLSNVKLNRDKPPCPRFNMPFELGLAAAVKYYRVNGKHSFYILEKKPYRLQKSLSDLNGFDPLIHGGKVVGMLSSIMQTFSNPANRLDERHFQFAYNELKLVAGPNSIFNKYDFERVVGAGFEIGQIARRKVV